MIRNPIPSTTRKNDGGYDADSGLDILVPVGTPCLAVADGRVIYSERGHTPWVANADHPYDTPNSVLLQLDTPVKVAGVTVNFAWYTHLSKLAYQVPDGSEPLVVKSGQVLGWSGTGNNVPHLHLGLVNDRAQTRTVPQRDIANLIWGPPGGPTTSPTAPPPAAEPVTRQPVTLVSAEFVVRDAQGRYHKLFHNANGTTLVGPA